MNKLARQQKTNQNLNKIDFSKMGRFNHCDYNSHNGEPHEDLKWEVFKQARKQGFIVITEAIFKDKSGIADCYLPEVDIVYEILCSETIERFKKKKYPVKKIVPIRKKSEIII